MNRELLPIGSIVKVQDIRALIGGYYFDKEGREKPELNYMLVPYPLGLAEDTMLTKCRVQDVELMHEGYSNDLGKSFTGYVEFMNEYLNDHSEEELLAFIKETDSEIIG